LSRRRLVACTLATGAVFAAVKLDAGAARALVALISHLGRPAAIYLDRSDLLCLPALLVAWWIGRDELRRVPLGRPAAIHRPGPPWPRRCAARRRSAGAHRRARRRARRLGRACDRPLARRAPA